MNNEQQVQERIDKLEESVFILAQALENILDYHLIDDPDKFLHLYYRVQEVRQGLTERYNEIQNS